MKCGVDEFSLKPLRQVVMTIQVGILGEGTEFLSTQYQIRPDS